MAGDVSNPRIWEGADAYVGDLGATAPTDVSSAWGAEWEALGLLSEDGATLGRDQDVKEHYAWGGKLVRVSMSKHKRTLKIVALEDNDVLFDLVNPGSEYTEAGGVTTRTIKVPTGGDIRAFGLETVDGDYTSRIVIPRGQVVEVADIVLSQEDISAKEITINILADDDDVFYYELTNDPQAYGS